MNSVAKSHAYLDALLLLKQEVREFKVRTSKGTTILPYFT